MTVVGYRTITISDVVDAYICHIISHVAGTFCGVFRRQALDRGAMLLGCNKIITGRVFLHSLGPYTLTSFLVPVNWHVCHATSTSRF